MQYSRSEVTSNFNTKGVHNGFGTSPDRVSNGNWTDAMVTRITKQ